MAVRAESQLATDAVVVNALNVFPVPDGDTGTNMLATIREALAQGSKGLSLAETVDRLARGALLGARGNSGVILSQLFRAQQEVLGARAGAHGITAGEVAAILSIAAQLATNAIADPVEGTMLSVLRAAANPSGSTSAPSLESVIAATQAAIAATPDQLPILREAGVVDAGGYGLLCVLRGWYEALTGSPPPAAKQAFLGLERAREQAAAGMVHPASLLERAQQSHGWCVTVLVEAPQASEAHVRQRLQTLGESALVVAAGGQLKLHVHVPDAEDALAFARGLGAVVRSEVSNIDDQTGLAALPVVAVVAGEGLARVFKGLGAAVVSGGQTQNPSTAELLAACQRLTPPVFLLPNNGNVVASARQAAAECPGVEVVPTHSIPQGVAAALAYDPGVSAEHNLERMVSAAARVMSVELVSAARAATLSGVQVEPGQTMVLVDGELLGAGNAGLAALGERVRQADMELVTIYYGLAASPAEAERLAAMFPDLQAEVVRGDQPHSAFIMGFE